MSKETFLLAYLSTYGGTVADARKAFSRLSSRKLKRIVRNFEKTIYGND